MQIKHQKHLISKGTTYYCTCSPFGFKVVCRAGLEHGLNIQIMTSSRHPATKFNLFSECYINSGIKLLRSFSPRPLGFQALELSGIYWGQKCASVRADADTLNIFYKGHRFQATSLKIWQFFCCPLSLALRSAKIWLVVPYFLIMY